MRIKAIETFLVTLPFRFSFGHSLATRAQSTNLIVRVTLDDGTQGFGEGVPRDYVTGEDAEAAQHSVDSLYARRFLGVDVSDPQHLLRLLEVTFAELGLRSTAHGASWCALELALLDAVSKLHEHAVADWFGPVLTERVRYGGVIPFGGKKAVLGMLWFYRLYGFQTVKIKVGNSLEEDIAKVALARKIMGEKATIRVDANCAWNVDQALAAAEAFRPYRVASYEQPVAPDQLEALQKITAAIPEQVLVDESLCTIEQAEMLASEKICSAFNIRVSKVGGILAANRMVEIANAHGIACHMGAQVGESGILSAAARTFAMVHMPFENYEGSMNGFLLRHDLTEENLTVRFGGYGDLGYSRQQKFGFGIRIGEGILESWSHSAHSSVPHAAIHLKTDATESVQVG